MKKINVIKSIFFTLVLLLCYHNTSSADPYNLNSLIIDISADSKVLIDFNYLNPITIRLTNIGNTEHIIPILSWINVRTIFPSGDQGVWHWNYGDTLCPPTNLPSDVIGKKIAVNDSFSFTYSFENWYSANMRRNNKSNLDFYQNGIYITWIELVYRHEKRSFINYSNAIFFERK